VRQTGLKFSAGGEGLYVLGGVDCAAQSCVASCGCAVGSNMGVGAGARGTDEPQGRLCCVGWSHQFKRVSLGHVGQYWMGIGCPGLPKSAPLVGPGSSQLTSMQLRGWC
jgi:hypothetical protein